MRGEGAESPAVPFPGGPRRRVAGGGGCLRWDFAGGRVFPGCGPKTGQFTLEVRRGGGGLFLAGRSVRKCFGSVDGLKKFVVSLTCGEGVSEFSPACSSRGVV